jgi:bifunctional enzyme CysN/CysC
VREPSPASISRQRRAAALGFVGATVWITALPAAGKSTLALALEQELLNHGRPAYRIDGDEVRRELCRDLGFDHESRTENVRRVAHVARMLADAGVVTIVALISPYATDREQARQIHSDAGLRFLEIFIDTPLELCERRDPKGLYARARRGELKGFTGVDGDYERPRHPDLRLEPEPLALSVRRVCDMLAADGALGPEADGALGPEAVGPSEPPRVSTG